jgi:transcriptional regulator with XRE-family HTH domain
MSVRVRGDIVKAKRKRLGLTQEEFANLCQTTSRTIKKAEGNEGISPSIARRIAGSLQIDIEDLFAFESCSGEFAAYDLTCGIMREIYNLKILVDLITDWESCTGKQADLGLAARELVGLSERLLGPFEAPKNRRIGSLTYSID